MYEFRDKTAKEYGFDLKVYRNPQGAQLGINPFIHGSAKHTDIMKTEGLKQALDKYGFDAAFGGARRDEENRVLKSVFTHLEIDLIVGIRKINVQNYGKTTTAKLIKGKVFAFFHYQIGRS